MYEENALSHHGIKGQKWYQRRFQNADGSLTAAGRKRYLKDLERVEKNKKKAERKQVKEQVKQEKKLQERMKSIEEKKKQIYESNNVEEMRKNSKLFTDAEINSFINKVNLDNRLKALNSSNQKNLIDKTVGAIDKVSTLANTSVKAFDSYTNIAKRVNRIMGDTVLPDFDAEAAKKAATIARQKALRNIPYDKVLANASRYSDEDLKYISDRINTMNNLHNNIENANNNKIKKTKEAKKQAREQELQKVSYDEILQNPNKFSDDDLVYLNTRYKNMSGMMTNVSNVESKIRIPSKPIDSDISQRADDLIRDRSTAEVTMESIDPSRMNDVVSILDDLKMRSIY